MNKTYLFDFDGTLVDSMPTFARVMLQILDEYKISYSDDVIKVVTPLGYLGTADYFISLGLPMERDKLVKLMNDRIKFEYENTILAKEGVEQTLIKMKELGCSLNVLTASPHLLLDPCLKRIGIFDLFDNVWSCDDFNTSKADPNIYIRVAERLNKKVGEVNFVDDNINAVKTSIKAGMVGIGIYDKSGEDFAHEFKTIADNYVYNFKELL